MRIARFVLLILWLWPAFAAAQGGNWKLDDLLRSMAQTTQSQARFEQTIYASYLDQPLHASGRVSYRAPDLMVMDFEKPQRHRVTFKGGEVRVEENIGTDAQSVHSEDDPLLRAVVTSLRALFAGDGAALAKSFEIAFTGTRDAWQMILKPKDATVASALNAIDISGRDNLVLRYELKRSDGDRVVMTFTPLP